MQGFWSKAHLGKRATHISIFYYLYILGILLNWCICIFEINFSINLLDQLLNLDILANSVNSNCHPFQVKINCSKFIVDGLQQRCHMSLLISLFVTSRNLLFGVLLPRKIITILRKITMNFRQVSPNGVLFLVKVLQHFVKIL